MAVPLSEEWFEAGRALMAELPARPGISCALQFQADDIRWHLVIVDGQVTRWGLGVMEDPQVTVRLPIEVARSIHRPGASGTEALAACVVVEADGSEAVVAPIDVAHRPEIEDLPLVPDADLLVQYHLADGPFGEVDVWWSFESGRSADMDFGTTTSEPDVVVWVPFQRVAPVRSGAISILDALEDGGRVEGEEGPLMLYAGLEESPELELAGRSCGPSAAAFGALGAVAADPVFQDALVRLTEAER